MPRFTQSTRIWSNLKFALHEPKYQFVLVLLILTGTVLGVALLPILNSDSASFKSVAVGGHSPRVVLDGRLETEGTENVPEYLVLAFKTLTLRGDLFKVDSQNQIASKICVKVLRVDFHLAGRNWDLYSGAENPMPRMVYSTGEVAPLCTQFSMTRPESEPEQLGRGVPIDETYRIDVPPSVYYEYPYERMILEAILYVDFELYDQSDRLLLVGSRAGSFRLENHTQEWEMLNKSQPPHGKFAIEIRRPPLIRYLTAFLLIPIILVPFLTAWVDAFDTAAEVVIAVILGLWGIRQLILPDKIPGLNLIDVVLLGEYGILTVALLGSAYIHARKGKLKGEK